MDKARQMEDEMSRFEAEISGTMMNCYGPYGFPAQGGMPPMMIPHQVAHHTQARMTSNKRSYDNAFHLQSQPIIAQPAVVSAKPTLYTTTSNTKPMPPIATQTPVQASSNVDFMSIQSEVEKKLKKLKNEKVSAEVAISQGKASSALQSFGPDDYKRRGGGGKNKKLMRTAGGTVWEDTSLVEWQEDDFRIFCGDLGNDVTDELLARTFNKYPSFLKARVVRDKRTNKTKGYGFVSFKDPSDFTKAMKEMNGRYVGSRPIKLRKSTWKNRCVDVVKKKEKERAALINMLTSGSNNAR